jgi:hypothetical protein
VVLAEMEPFQGSKRLGEDTANQVFFFAFLDRTFKIGFRNTAFVTVDLNKFPALFSQTIEFLFGHH